MSWLVPERPETPGGEQETGSESGSIRRPQQRDFCRPEAPDSHLDFFCCRVKTTKSCEDRGSGSAVLEESSCCPFFHKPTSALTRASGESLFLQEQWPLPAQWMLAGSYFGPALVGLGLITAVRWGTLPCTHRLCLLSQ